DLATISLNVSAPSQRRRISMADRFGVTARSGASNTVRRRIRSSCKRTPRASRGRVSGAIFMLAFYTRGFAREKRYWRRPKSASARLRDVGARQCFVGCAAGLFAGSLVRRVVARGFEANGAIVHNRCRPAHDLRLLPARDGPRRRRRLLPRYCSGRNRLLRHEAEYFAVLLISHEPDRALPVHLHIPDAAAEVGQHQLVLFHLAVDDARANEAFGNQSAVQQIATPLRKQASSVYGES